jgi:hypothetical protein
VPKAEALGAVGCVALMPVVHWMLTGASEAVMQVTLLGVAIAGAAASVYDRRWSLTLDGEGLAIVKPGERVRMAWGEVAAVRVESTRSDRRPCLAVVPRKGLGRVPVRFLPSRLAAADRRRLGRAFAERGFPLELA